MKITKPELNVVRFANEDVIATSLFYIPASQFQGSYSGSGNYVAFEGTSQVHSDGLWTISESSIYGAEAGIDDDRDTLVNGGGEMAGWPIFADMLVPIAKQTMDAYYEDGTYYTKGVTYYEQYFNQ